MKITLTHVKIRRVLPSYLTITKVKQSKKIYNRAKEKRVDALTKE